MSKSISGRVAVAVTGLVAGLLVAGCFGDSRPERGAGSALWLAPESAPADALRLARLEALGIKNLFIAAARLEWSGTTPRLERRALVAPARRLPATLVVSGEWSAGEVDPEATAERLAGEIATLEAQAERTGLLVVGIHFDLRLPRRLEDYARALEKLRRRLDGRLLISIDLDRRGLDRQGIGELAKAADFVVCFLYGQRPAEVEDPQAWDLRSVEANVRKLESLGAEYLLGAAVVGAAQWLGPAGRIKESSSAPSLRSLVDNRSLELVPGFSLQGIDRQVFEFTARAPLVVGSWRLAKGDRIRVVKTATPILEELLRRAGAWAAPHRLGELFHRAPGQGEGMALELRSLEAALSPEPAAPRLELEVQRTLRSEGAWRIRVRLINRGAEPTDLAFFDSNFVELRVGAGRIGDVELGAFHRYELLHDGREKGTMRALRDADTARLYAPMVEGGEVVESGEIEIVLRGEATSLTLSASFLLPEGRMLEIEPVEWSFAETP